MKTVRTARGRILDMGALRAKHEETRAVSNIPVNARGDIIDSRGNVKVSREKISKEYYKDTIVGVEEKVSIKTEVDEPVVNPITEPAPEPVPEPAPEPTPKSEPEQEEVFELARRERTRDDGSSYWEIEYSDGSMETQEN